MRKQNLILRIIAAIPTIIAVALAITLVLPRGFACRPYAVLSGSMSPEYNTGDLVYVKSVDWNEISIGDVITYYNENADIYVTHRVVNIDEDAEKITTKGDNNENADVYAVCRDDVVGVVVFSLPLFGYVATFLSTAAGKGIVFGAFISTWLVCGILSKILTRDKQAERSD